ncbi:MAG: SDR family oxidoreductase [Gemmatimonadota bacterium]|nr:SDR family oxidoreductase [Gemmatimonadota bacterium]
MSAPRGAGGVFADGLLDGRTAFITGGGSGIGYGISSCLASAGANLSIFSRSEERLTGAAERLSAEYGVDVHTHAGDVRDAAAVQDAMNGARDRFGGVDILVNNAAGNFYAPTETLSANAWRAVIEIDLYGTFYACQAAFPIMSAQGFGRIVSTSMTLHYRGWPLMAHATAAKAGVDALTRTLALEWARHGINVNAVAPGPIPTEGVKKAFEAPTSGTQDMFGERAMEAFATRFIPVGRVGEPADIGNMVTFLASPAGDWISGQIFVVDGGESLASPRAIPEPGSQTEAE